MDRKLYFVTQESISGKSEVPEIKNHKLLIESARRICTALVKDYPNKLPDALVFPETSAPPLWKLISHDLKLISEQKQVPMPEVFSFFNLNPVLPPGNDSYFDILTIQDYLKEKKRAQPLHGVQAQKILRTLKLNGIRNPSIAVIDDYISEQCSTIKTISEAFGFPLPIYAFFSNISAKEINQTIKNKVVIGMENINF